MRSFYLQRMRKRKRRKRKRKSLCPPRSLLERRLLPASRSGGPRPRVRRVSVDGTEGAHRLGEPALSFRGLEASGDIKKLRHQKGTPCLEARVSFSGVFPLMVLKYRDQYVLPALAPSPPLPAQGLCEPGKTDDFSFVIF